MQVLPGQSVGNMFKEGLEHHYNKALGYASNVLGRANNAVSDLRNFGGNNGIERRGYTPHQLTSMPTGGLGQLASHLG